MTHPKKGVITYKQLGGSIFKSENEAPGAPGVPINDVNANFSAMKFCVIGSDANDNQTPRVTILLSVGTLRSPESFNINLQTTVSSRDVSDEFQNP